MLHSVQGSVTMSVIFVRTYYYGIGHFEHIGWFLCQSTFVVCHFAAVIFYAENNYLVVSN